MPQAGCLADAGWLADRRARRAGRAPSYTITRILGDKRVVAPYRVGGPPPPRCVPPTQARKAARSPLTHLSLCVLHAARLFRGTRHMTLPWPIAAACTISIVGDVAVVLTCFMLWMDNGPSDVGTSDRTRLAKCNFSVRYVAYLAAANVITSAIGIVNGTVSNRLAGPLCAALGAIMWWSTWASWLWTAAIASAFYRHFSRPVAFSDGDATHERVSHIVCWGGGLALVGAAYATRNHFGASDSDNDSDACTFVTPPNSDQFAMQSANVLVLGTLLLVLLANVWAFFCVHRVLERSRRLAERLLVEQHEELAPAAAPRAEHSRTAAQPPSHTAHAGSGAAADGASDRVPFRALDDAATAAAPPRPRQLWQTQRRVALWPTFAAYVGVFLLSQGPGALCNLFPGGEGEDWIHAIGRVCDGPLSTPVPLTNQMLMYLHGAFNTIVYGCSNKHILSRWLLCSPRRWCDWWQDWRDGRAAGSLLQRGLSERAAGALSNEHFRT